AAVWLRPTDAEPSLSPAKFVNDRFGGPQLMGSCAVPRMPSSAATFDVYAKYGSAVVRLRLKLKLRLLLNRGLKLWLQPAPVLQPFPPEVSSKPNSVWLL